MRERKFRAWSKKHNKYLKLTGIRYDDDKFAGVFVIYGTIAGIPNTIFLEPEDVILEQYTGLKDKNGKEIYEGDIVGFKWTKRLYVVTYRIYDASFILENDEWEEAIRLSLDKDDFEVFGNIHENPELLEKEK